MAWGTILLKPHVTQVKLFNFGQTKVGYHLTVAITIHSYVTIRSIFEGVRSNDANQPINRTKPSLFRDALIAFVMLLAEYNFNINNSVYLRNHCAKNELRR